MIFYDFYGKKTLCRPIRSVSILVMNKLLFSIHIAVYSSPPLPDNVFEGDIELTQEQLMNIDIYGDIRGNVSRAAGSNSRIRWPNGIIPYEIDCSLRK